MSVQGEVTPFSIRMLSDTLRIRYVDILSAFVPMPLWCGLVVTMCLSCLRNPHSLRNEARGSTGHSDMFLLATSMFKCSTEHIYPG